MRDRLLPEGRVTIQEDVTERVDAEGLMSRMALHDSLTELFNRQAFIKHLDDATIRPRAGLLALLLLDVDGFKQVNDSYGHEIGDRVLVEIARRLEREAQGHFVARLGGDEFVVVLSGDNLDVENVHALVERILSAGRGRLEIDGRQIGVGMSAGIKLSTAITSTQRACFAGPTWRYTRRKTAAAIRSGTLTNPWSGAFSNGLLWGRRFARRSSRSAWKSIINRSFAPSGATSSAWKRWSDGAIPSAG